MESKRIFRLLGASIFATSAMTVFSYVLSKVCKENFSEPDLLSKVIAKRAHPVPKGILQAWAVHYLIGILWSVVYQIPNNGRPGTSSAPGKVAVFGIVSGLIAAAAWRIMLERHPQTLRASGPSFFLQLVPAHVVYAFALKYCHTFYQCDRFVFHSLSAGHRLCQQFFNPHPVNILTATTTSRKASGLNMFFRRIIK